MKYIRQEHLITTVCNENVYDEEIVKKLLNKIKSDSIYFSISYKREVGFTDSIVNYDNVRISAVKEDRFDFSVYGKASITSIKNIPFEDIIKIRVVTEKKNILVNKDNKNKFSLLGLEEKKWKHQLK